MNAYTIRASRWGVLLYFLFLMGSAGLQAAAAFTPTVSTNWRSVVRKRYSIQGLPVAVKTVTSDLNGRFESLQFIFVDHLGTVSATVDPFGNVTERPSYTPFGLPTGLSMVTDRGYTGHRHDRKTGLIYMNARWYDPQLGRMISADSIVANQTLPQTINRFSYALNNPIRYIDPSGHICVDSGMDAALPGNCNGGSIPVVLPSNPILVLFAADEAAAWDMETKQMLREAAADMASRMATAYNEGKTPSEQMTPADLFRAVFNGPITARKTNRNCTIALDCLAWVNHGETVVNIRHITNGYLFIHEIFHIFDLTLLDGAATNALWNEQQIDRTFPNRPHLTGSNPNSWGFAGGNFSNWQKSRSGLAAEEFADMGIGWTYNSWESDADGLTEAGLARSDFMDVNMAVWLEQLVP